MTKRSSLLISAWALSCGAAFYIGHTTTSPTSQEGSPSDPQENQVTRTSNRSDSQAGPRSGGSRITGSRNRSDSFNSVKDYTEEVVALANLSDPIERAQGMLALVDNLSPSEFEDVIAAFRELGMTRERMSEYGILLTAWAKADPIAALDYAKENTGTPFARETILASWAQTQPESAIAWAKENFEGDEEQRNANPWLVGIIKGIASQDLTRATQLLEDLPFSRGRGEALGAVLTQLSQQDAESGRQWIAGLADERLRDGAAARFAQENASSDPAGTLAWVSSISETALQRAADDVVQRWATDDPAAARAWLESQPDQVKASAARGYINTIASKDPTEAAQWLSQYEGQPEYDGAIQSLVWRASGDNPELSADWVMKLTNERQRERTFHGMLGRWMRDDSQAAMNYIQNNDVPESIQQRAEMMMERQLNR